MVSNFPGWIQATVALVIAFGGLGVAYAYFSQGRARNVIDLQKEELQIAKDTNARLVAENMAKEKERLYLTDKIGNLEKQIAWLQNTVTAAPQIAKLSQDVVQQHQEVVTALNRVVTLLENGHDGLPAN